MDWTKDKIHLMLTMGTQVEAALKILNAQQTPDEKSEGAAKYRNGRGFGKWDARFGSSLASQVERGMRLTERQEAAARRMLARYEGQIAEILNERRQYNGTGSV